MNTSRTCSPNQRAPARPGSLFGIIVVLWILFAAALIFNQSALDSAWNWLTDLPLLVQVAVWVLLLPITLSLWIWESDWALWTRVLLIVAIGVGNLATCGPRNRTRTGQNSPDPFAGGDRLAPETWTNTPMEGDREMKTVVVYDSKFGNTERLAQLIAENLSTGERVALLPADEASEQDLVGISLLAVGGPTQGHGASPNLRAFLDRLSPASVQGVAIATFDTRLTWPRLLAGSAASVAAKRLVTHGARLLVPPESFLVQGSKGPLLAGEMERACAWARDVRDKIGESARASAVATMRG